MLIAILSDSHDHYQNLAKAVEIANQRGCQLLLHAGDLVAPPMVDILAKFQGGVKMVLGNNEAEIGGLIFKSQQYENVSLEGLTQGNYFEGEADGRKIFMNHYPKIARLAAQSGEYELCVFGHTHQYHEEKVGQAILLNPGEISGMATGKPGFVIFDTKTKECGRVEL